MQEPRDIELIKLITKMENVLNEAKLTPNEDRVVVSVLMMKRAIRRP